MGGGGEVEEPIEPNFTALLDLVLQMVMFFMVVASFVNEQLNENIQLPLATTTLPIDKEETAILMLNIDKDGKLIIPPKKQYLQNANEVFDTPLKISQVMDRIYKDEKKPKDLTVVVRADHNATFEQVYRVMKAAKEVGFVNVQLRAKIQKK